VALRWELPWYLRSRNRWPNWAVRPVVQREHAADAGNRVHGNLHTQDHTQDDDASRGPPTDDSPAPTTSLSGGRGAGGTGSRTLKDDVDADDCTAKLS
jgi:hypothetical protein